MAESMRGTRLGATSYEVDSGELAPRLLTTYVCSQGHDTTLPFALEADEIPDTWECSCGEVAGRVGAALQLATPQKHVRTHWDMLRERRSVKDLEALLRERLELIRGAATRSA
ncbi:MAG: RNA polymerase-binding protein RbpA [Actinomycetes bacterium]